MIIVHVHVHCKSITTEQHCQEKVFYFYELVMTECQHK